jgi:flagella basal body P-ring formation protein FlgA
MFRFATLCAVMALALPALPAKAQTPAADAQARPTLKASAMVVSDIVRIGDLVDNAGAVADVAIFRAPDLGETGAVPVSRVLDVLRSRNLVGVDTLGLTDINVTHAARMITRQQIEARIVGELAGHHGLGEAKNLSAILDRDPRAIYVEPSNTHDLQISRLSYDPRTGRFDVILDVPGSAMLRRDALHFTGAIAETVEVPVMARQVGRSEVMKVADIVMERRPKSELTGDVIADAEQLIGFAARRPLRPGQLLRTADVMRPEVVQRNDTVTLFYEVPGIRLTMRAKALEAGAEGDIINVLNLQSKRTLQATVRGPGRVSITPSLPPAAAGEQAPIRTSTLTSNPTE